MTDKVVAPIRVGQTDFLIVVVLVVPLEFQSFWIFSPSLALSKFCGWGFERYLRHHMASHRLMKKKM